MAKNWAIAIGINQYDFLQPLNYAKRDAQLMSDFLRTQAGFEQIFFFSDDSPDLNGKSTLPYRTNLLRILRQLFEQPFMQPGDNFWFFFSGHGMPHNGCDYLMPSDGDPGDVENTAIPINYINQRLRRCGADNVVLILDACRKGINTRAGEGIGRQTAEQARQTGVISIFSCSPNEYSYEFQELQQGAFTYSLLQGLGIQGQCATLERLNQYLEFRVPQIVHQYQSQNARQTPYIIAEPITKSHLILIPQYATLRDIATLKNDAYQALLEGDLDLGEQLWIRVLAAASGQDIDAVRALQRIERLRVGHKEVDLPSDIVKQGITEKSSFTFEFFDESSQTIEANGADSADKLPDVPTIRYDVEPLVIEETHSISQEPDVPASVPAAELPIIEETNSISQRPIFRRYSIASQRWLRQAAWAGMGVSSLAVAAITFGLIPVPQIHQSQSKPQEKVSPTTKSVNSSAPKSATPTPSTSLTVTNDLETLLKTVPEITDASQLRELNRQVYNQINPDWANRSALNEDLVYRIGVAGDGAIVGYKAMNKEANQAIEKTPLPKLLYNPAKRGAIENQPIAQFRVVFTQQGVLQISHWRGYANTPEVIGAKITDANAVKDLNKKLYDTIRQNWGGNPTFSRDLKYRVAVNKDGTIADYEPLNQVAFDYFRETPLPKIFYEVYRSNVAAPNTKDPLAHFQVVFQPNGNLEVTPWEGYR